MRAAVSQGRNAALGSFPALLLAAASITLGAFSFAAAGSSGGGGFWRAYRVLLIDSTVPRIELHRALAREGIAEPISRASQTVQVSDWVRLESVALPNALERLIMGDPRRDSYIERLGSWFSAEAEGRSYEILYLPDTAFIDMGLRLRRALEPFRGGYLLPEGSHLLGAGSGPRLRDAAVAILVLALSIVATQKARFSQLGTAPLDRAAFRAALAAPWLPLSLAGPEAALITALWGCSMVDLAAILELPMDEYRRSGRIGKALGNVYIGHSSDMALLAAALASLALAPALITSAILNIVASLLALAAFASAMRSGALGSRRFVPRPLAIRPPRRRKRSSVLPLVLVLTVLLFVGRQLWMGLPRGESASSILLPLPVAREGSLRPLPSEARALLTSRGPTELPDLVDWLAHLAFQEAIPLEKVGSNRDSSFDSVEVVARDGSSVRLDFDDSWARAAYRSLGMAGVERLLLAQGKPVSAHVRSPRTQAESEGPLAPMEALMYILLLIPLIWRIIAGLPAARSPHSDEIRQEA